VNRNFTIRRLLAILMIAGLALAPASRPVMAATSPHISQEAMADEMTSEAAASELASVTIDEMAG
jgi:hypothetical protein